MYSSILTWLILPALLAQEAAPPAIAIPRIDIERLQTQWPGWVMMESKGDPSSGSVVAEQVIWPMFYLHWRPLGEGIGETITPEKAAEAVMSLWKDVTVDGPLQGQRFSVPAHDGVVFETTTAKGERKTRYMVWSCPESARLIIVDANLSLLANAPSVLLDWQRDMARTVRCHPDGRIDTYPHLPERAEIPDAELSYSHPRTWLPLPGYRMQESFGGSDFAVANSVANTSRTGQYLTLAVDAVLRIHLMWGPAEDQPMSYNVVRQKAEEYWRQHAKNVMIQASRAANEIWSTEGLVRLERLPSDVPPTHLSKFRAWMWTRGPTTYFVVGTIGGIGFGRRKPGLTQEGWDLLLEEMRRSVVEGPHRTAAAAPSTP